MRRSLVALTRVVLYVLAFLVPPVVLSIAGVQAALADRYEPTPNAANLQVGEFSPPAHDPGKPTAVVLLGTQGSEVTDVLAPYEVLSKSGAFNVYAVAPERVLATLSGGLDVVPQLSFAELEQRLGGKEPDVVVVPAMWHVGSAEHRPVADWLLKHAAGTGTIISVCDGAEVLADAGLLDGRRATANWANIARWEDRYPKTAWVRGLRYIEDGNIVLSAGVTSGVAATLHVIRKQIGDEAAAALARQIGYPDQRLGDEPPIPADHLTVSDRTLYVLSGAYAWNRPRVGVVLTEGATEIELASAFDVYPGSAFNARAIALAPGGPRSPIRSEHGLFFVPRSDLVGAPKLDRVLVPGRDAPAATDPQVSAWSRDRGIGLAFVHAGGSAGSAAGFPFDGTILDLARHENAPVARFTARLLEYPTAQLDLAGAGWPFALLLRPLAVGLLGLALAVLIDRLGTASRKRRHPAS